MIDNASIGAAAAAAAALATERRDDAATAATASPHPLHATVDAWFASHFHNSIVSRDTEILNLLHAAVQDLKRRLTA